MVNQKTQTTRRVSLAVNAAFCFYFPQTKRGTADEGESCREMVVVEVGRGGGR